MRTVRCLDDLADLNNIKSKDGKYKIKTRVTDFNNKYDLYVKVIFSDLIINIFLNKTKDYFIEKNIINTINILKDLNFDVEYEKDDNSKVALSLIQLAASVNLDGSNIEGKIDGIKNIVRRLEKLKWNK